MKRDPQHRQPDLFDSDAQAPPVLPSLQAELVDLLSHLLWQVARAQTPTDQGGDGEQDRT